MSTHSKIVFSLANEGNFVICDDTGESYHYAREAGQAWRDKFQLILLTY